MDITPLSLAIEVDWLAASPIGPYTVAFKEHLTELRYAASTIADYLADIKHFARWVHTRRLPLARIDDGAGRGAIRGVHVTRGGRR